MKGRPVQVWADIAITQLDNGEFAVWRSDGNDYGTKLKQKPTEKEARDYAFRYDRVKPVSLTKE